MVREIAQSLVLNLFGSPDLKERRIQERSVQERRSIKRSLTSDENDTNVYCYSVPYPEFFWAYWYT